MDTTNATANQETTMNTKEGIRILGAYTAGHFDIYMLAGSRKGTCRKHVMEALTGVKMPIAKCGITAMRAAFDQALSVGGDCIAARESDFLNKVRALVAA